MPKLVEKFAKYQISYPKMPNYFEKFCHFSKISSNLVTLNEREKSVSAKERNLSRKLLPNIFR